MTVQYINIIIFKSLITADIISQENILYTLSALNHKLH